MRNFKPPLQNFYQDLCERRRDAAGGKKIFERDLRSTGANKKNARGGKKDFVILSWVLVLLKEQQLLRTQERTPVAFAALIDKIL